MKAIIRLTLLVFCSFFFIVAIHAQNEGIKAPDSLQVLAYTQMVYQPNEDGTIDSASVIDHYQLMAIVQMPVIDQVAGISVELLDAQAQILTERYEYPFDQSNDLPEGRSFARDSYTVTIGVGKFQAFPEQYTCIVRVRYLDNSLSAPASFSTIH